MNDLAIRIENLGKLYRLGEVGTGTLSHDLNRWWHRVRGKEDPYQKIGQSNDRTREVESDYVWALRDINLEVKKGEVLGIIGRNGAGKSTLLKILSQVTSPTTGRVEVFGRIASLLEVGTGFHPELTGRENIFLNGAILGMRRHEIQKRFDEIVDFAGVEAYIDTPVKRYSSGMYVRLAFAVAAFLESEILVVDEVLAVGDSEFRNRCLGRIGDLTQEKGRTVCIVSHDMTSVASLCERTIVLESGESRFVGDTANAIEVYLGSRQLSLNGANRKGDGTLRISEISLISDGVKKAIFHSGQRLEIKIQFERDLDSQDLNAIQLILEINNHLGKKVVSFSNKYCEEVQLNSMSRWSSFVCLVPELLLAEGVYSIDLWLSYRGGHSDEIREAVSFEVIGSDFYKSGIMPVARKHGDVLARQEWRTEV